MLRLRVKPNVIKLRRKGGRGLRHDDSSIFNSRGDPDFRQDRSEYLKRPFQCINQLLIRLQFRP